jgi:glucokinase
LTSEAHLLKQGLSTVTAIVLPKVLHQPIHLIMLMITWNNLIKELVAAEKQLEGPYKIAGVGMELQTVIFIAAPLKMPPTLNGEVSIPFADMVNKHYNVPVRLTNDANAAALGEMVYGGARGMKDFIMITLGTGLGSGIVVNGDLVYGHDGFAGELGHVNVVENGRKCGCGNHGCLETYVSAPGIKRTVFELLARDSREASWLITALMNLILK